MALRPLLRELGEDMFAASRDEDIVYSTGHVADMKSNRYAFYARTSRQSPSRALTHSENRGGKWVLTIVPLTCPQRQIDVQQTSLQRLALLLVSKKIDPQMQEGSSRAYKDMKIQAAAAHVLNAWRRRAIQSWLLTQSTKNGQPTAGVQAAQQSLECVRASSFEVLPSKRWWLSVDTKSLIENPAKQKIIVLPHLT